jgi:hypothetical protein
VTDPVGDATPDPTGAISPDLTSATLDVAGGVLTATVSFAPGTLSRTTTLWSVVLDTDENPSTGVQIQGDTFLGIDYVITGQGAALAFRKLEMEQQVLVGTGTVSFLTDNDVSLSVPLSLLGGGDGRMHFRVTAKNVVNGVVPFTSADYMPDVRLAPGVVR